MSTKASVVKANPNLERGMRQEEAIDLISRIVCEVVKTPGLKKVILSVLSNILSAWSEESLIKKKVSGNAIKMASSVIDPEGVPKTRLVDSALWTDPETFPGMLNAMPVLVNTILSIFMKMEEGIKQLPPKVQADYIRQMVEEVDTENIGKLLTSFAEHISDIHKEYPTFISDSVLKLVLDIVAKTDFGALREAVEGSSEDIAVAIKAVVDAIFLKNTFKGTNLIAAVPPIINGVVKGLAESLKPGVEIYSPSTIGEMLANIIHTAVEGIDGKEIGRLIDYSNKMISALHTGDKLWGEGKPKIPEALSGKLRDIISAIDPQSFSEAKAARSEYIEELVTSVNDILWENATFMLPLISGAPFMINPLIRSSRKIVSKVAEAPPDLFIDSVSVAMEGIDTQEIGETLNSFVRAINSIHEASPELLPEFISGIVSSVDASEVRKFVDAVAKPLLNTLSGATYGEDTK